MRRLTAACQGRIALLHLHPSARGLQDLQQAARDAIDLVGVISGQIGSEIDRSKSRSATGKSPGR